MDNLEMFRKDEPRYITRGIKAKLPLEYQIMLWNTVDSLRDSNTIALDYLQVFKLSLIEEKGERFLSIIHTQEEPDYYLEYILPVGTNDVPTGKIYIVDDRDHATMLWADEY